MTTTSAPAPPSARGPVGPATLDVTVVVPVRNEGGHVEAVLADLLAQRFPAERMEVLVVDGRSTDDTRARVEAVAARDGRVVLLDNPGRLSSRARAIGVAAARGRFVAFVDGHCRVPSATMLADMVELFERTGADCLARPQPLRADVGGAGGARRAPLAAAIAAARSSRFGHSLGSEIYRDGERPTSPVSSGAMYRREVFETVGTFDPDFDACEDVEFNTRVEAAGLSTWTSERLAVAYAPRTTWRGLFRQMVRYGVGRARLHRRHRGSFSVESLVPAAFVAGLPVLGAAPLLPGPLRLAVLAGYGVYAALAVAFGAAQVRRIGVGGAVLAALTFPVIHAGLGWGYLRGLATRGPSRRGDAP